MGEVSMKADVSHLVRTEAHRSAPTSHLSQFNDFCQIKPFEKKENTVEALTVNQRKPF